MSSSESPSPSATRWPDYRAVWRWHFYAGIFCIPFVIVLAISGAIYLFKAEIEGWSERSYDRLEKGADVALPSAQILAALAAFPGSTFEGYELPAGPGRAARVVVRSEAGSRRAYVDPTSLAILGSVSERDRFMKQVFRLHGELLMGNRGSNLVELAACWTIVMVLTGLVLWWPRQGRGLAGVVWPRLHGGRRLFWRDMHAVTGVWISLVTLALLFSGLPWAKFWGDSFKAARRVTGTAVARQGWSNDGGRSEATGAVGAPGAARGGEHAGHAGHGGGGRRSAPVELSAADLAAIDVVAATVTPLRLDAPVVLAHAPEGKGGGRPSRRRPTGRAGSISSSMGAAGRSSAATTSRPSIRSTRWSPWGSPFTRGACSAGPTSSSSSLPLPGLSSSVSVRCGCGCDAAIRAGLAHRHRGSPPGGACRLWPRSSPWVCFFPSLACRCWPSSSSNASSSGAWRR